MDKSDVIRLAEEKDAQRISEINLSALGYEYSPAETKNV